ncbi:hypothetical protein [Arthrobacter sp. 4R501]|uniref:hypothetical protein n=1 Tax=Arthrobacter sp. 4R501 TaxID=2058886 RepID=UPI0011B04190|nr:hypothetical protein [Arthrobacter sp. 4R501]
MGKQSRRLSRKNRTKFAASVTDGNLRIVVATTPTTVGSGVTLIPDLKLIRAALLYADHVELISPSATMLEGLNDLRSGGVPAFLALAAGLDDETLKYRIKGDDPAQTREMINRLLEYRALTRQERRSLDVSTQAAYQGAEQGLAGLYSAIGTREIEDHVAGSGHPEIEVALQSGLLSINHGVTSVLISKSATEFGESYGSLLQNLVSRGSALLLDEQMSRIVELMVAEGQLSPSGTTTNRSIKATTGTGLIARLPAFPHADVHQVLEARDQLDSHLLRYRRAVKGYSQKMVSRPFTDDLQDELDDMWLEEIQPSVNELQHQLSRKIIAQNTLWEGLAAGKSIATEAAAALIHFQAPALGLDQVLATATAAATAVAGVAPPIVKALQKANEAKKGDLYYLAALNSRLGPPSAAR